MAVITCEGMIGKAELANLIFRPLVSAPPKIQDDNEFFYKGLLGYADCRRTKAGV